MVPCGHFTNMQQVEGCSANLTLGDMAFYGAYQKNVVSKEAKLDTVSLDTEYLVGIGRSYLPLCMN